MVCESICEQKAGNVVPTDIWEAYKMDETPERSR